jgi:hypothetical protein
MWKHFEEVKLLSISPSAPDVAKGPKLRILIELVHNDVVAKADLAESSND